jgi:hypothetical protein
MAQTADGARLQTTVQMMVIILGTINKVDRAAGAGVTARAEKMLRNSATSRMQLSASSQPMLASTSQHSCAQLRTVAYSTVRIYVDMHTRGQRKWETVGKRRDWIAARDEWCLAQKRSPWHASGACVAIPRGSS